MSKKHKKMRKTLNDVEHLLILTSAFAGYVSISAFASSVGLLLGNASSAVGLKICTITAGIKVKSDIKKKRRKHHKVVLLAKTKLNTIEILIFKTLSHSHIVIKNLSYKLKILKLL